MYPRLSKRKLPLGWLPAFAFILAACSSSTQPAPPTQNPLLPTVAPTQPPLASPTLAATLPPPAIDDDTPAPAPTAALPTPVVSPTSAPPTPIPVLPANVIGPDFPENVNPFTGEAIDPARRGRRPIAIKVSNSSLVVRPQSGLSQADLVYEHISEGGITRFTALFYGQDAALVGPIRSGRLIDLQIPLWYDAAFAYSGASNEVKWMFKFGGFFERVVTPDWGHPGFWRDYEIGNPNKPDWETLYTSVESIRKVIAQRGEDTPASFGANMIFSPDIPTGGATASSIEIRYPATNVFWRYDAGASQYFRWADGDSHTDANNGLQLSARNVVVLYADHVETDIVEDSNGSLSIDIKFWESGKMILFRDGQRFDGEWRRVGMEAMLLYFDDAGNSLPLAPGVTWFQIVPSDFAGLIAGS